MNDLDKAYNKYVNNHTTVQNDILTLNNEAVTDYCEIDSNLRNITIPEVYKTAGVMADNNVKKIYFKINKFSQETDLSQLDIYINYQNGNNEADRYKVLDKQIEGDYIIFSWLISSFATKYKGTIKFIVCMNNENNIHWNSTLATLNVLEGLETDEAIADQNPDTIEEILKRLNDLEENGDTGDIDINSQKATFEIAETRENIKTGETIATILGKIKRYFTDLKKVAFTGSYDDLSNKPDIPEAYTLPQANENQLGGVKPVSKTSEMSQDVGVDKNGKLYTVPGNGNDGLSVSYDEETQTLKFTSSSGGGDLKKLLSNTVRYIEVDGEILEISNEKQWIKIAEITVQENDSVYEYTDLDNLTEIFIYTVGLMNISTTTSGMKIAINDDVSIGSIDTQTNTGTDTRYQRVYMKYNGMYWETRKTPHSNNETSYYDMFTNLLVPYSVKIGIDKCTKLKITVVNLQYALKSGTIYIYGR